MISRRASLGLVAGALGLAALHRAHKVHRDIKPSNILVTPEGRVVILDFGLVADLENRLPEAHLVGTYSYMAPEQASLKPVGAPADWYSVGVLLYQALTARMPVPGTAREVLVMKQAFEPAPPSTLVDVPPDLDNLAIDLLRIDPAARPSEREILRRLGVEAPPDDPDFWSHEPHFIGRKAELATLPLRAPEVLTWIARYDIGAPLLPCGAYEWFGRPAQAPWSARLG